MPDLPRRNRPHLMPRARLPGRATDDHTSGGHGAKRHPASVAYGGGDYTVEEEAFLKAADAYRRARRVKFLTAVDYLNVLKGLGWTPPAKE